MTIKEGYLLRLGRFKINYPTLKKLLRTNNISYFLYHHRGHQVAQKEENTFPQSYNEYGKDSIGHLSYFSIGSIEILQDDTEYIKVATYLYHNVIESHITIYTYRSNLNKLRDVLGQVV